MQIRQAVYEKSMPRVPKGKTAFACDACGHQTARWSGQCDACSAWNTVVEVSVGPRESGRATWAGQSGATVQQLSAVSTEQITRMRLDTNEINRVLGGGLVPGSLTLIAGDPGVGKSTLLLKISDEIAKAGHTVLYVSGEESPAQVKLRADRMTIAGERVLMLSTTNVEDIIANLEQHAPRLLVVDSIQTVYEESITSEPGSVNQIRECARRLMIWAKANDTAVILSGHVTKGGEIAGPRVLEHMVDVVLYMEGEVVSSWRLLRAVKNRFGATNEIGVFEMTSTGLEEVSDPSRALLSERSEGAIGSIPAITIEGNRPLLVEIQALTNPSFLPTPRRVATGVEHNRLLMVSAVLSRRTGISLANQDVLVNVTGGLRINEPAADLGMALAIASSLSNTPVAPDIAAIGEIGLTGEIRRVSQVERRVREVARLGLTRCLVPSGAQTEEVGIEGIEIVPVRNVGEAVGICVPDIAKLR